MQVSATIIRVGSSGGSEISVRERLELRANQGVVLLRSTAAHRQCGFMGEVRD